MSLCMVLRTTDGGVMMTADTALSIDYEGEKYRIANEEDDEKIIEHNGALIFCSGAHQKCKKIRSYIKNMRQLDLTKVQAYAQELYGHDTRDDSTGILVCWEDGSLVGMLSAQDFKLTPLPWDKEHLDIQALGFRMEEAYQAALKAVPDSEHGLEVIGKAYGAVLCEEVGGHLCVFSRLNGKLTKSKIVFKEGKSIKRGNFIEGDTCIKTPFHCIVSAQDFLLKSGESMVSVLNEKGQIKGEHIDARGINIVNKAGERVLYMNETGIHWDPKFSPFKTQYSVTANGPWHDTYVANDEYRRESTDGGITWGPGIKYVAKDGRDGVDGSDANVNYANIKAALQKASSLQSAFMTVDEMGAPKIYGGEIYGAKIFAGQSGGVGTGSVISLTDDGIKMYNEKNGTNLEIKSEWVPGIGATTALFNGSSPLLLNAQQVMIAHDPGTSSAHGMELNPSSTKFYGDVDFTDANVSGVVARFA